MELNVFHHQSYRQYLKARLEEQGPKSGSKRRAAEFLSVHTTFISQVVLNKADLSLDQGEKFNQFLKHTEEEGEFFLDLIIYERATDAKLKARFEKKLQKKQRDQLQINKRLEKTRELSEEQQDQFYSSNIYGLIHVLSSIPRYQSKEKMAQVLGQPLEFIDQAIQFLRKIDVIRVVDGKIIPGHQSIHLGQDSKNIWRHHANWRLATLQHFSRRTAEDLHYSLAFSCSEQDAKKLREVLLAQLKSMNTVIAKSLEETAYVYCFDFFQWT